MEKNRRAFIKKLGLISSAGLIAASPVSAAIKDSLTEVDESEKKSFTINILQTTDVHCQVHPHDELFWENKQIVFRKTGGYAFLADYFEKERKRNPYTFMVDTGDMFQGTELSVKTTGKAMVPILNELGYDLYLP